MADPAKLLAILQAPSPAPRPAPGGPPAPAPSGGTPAPRPAPAPRSAPAAGAPAPRPAPAGGPPAPPPAPGEPPAPPRGAEGLDAPEGDGEGETPRVNIEPNFPKVRNIKFLALVWLVLAGVLSLYVNLIQVSDYAEALNWGLGAGLTAAGMGLGVFAIFNEDWRRWMGYFSVFALIGGVAARPIVTPLVTSDIIYVLPGVLFAWALFAYYEYLDAYQRFTDVARMMVERNLQSFNVNQVIGNFLVRGGMLSAIFLVSALLIMTFVTQGFAAFFGQDLANSVEMQGIFGQALSILVIFTLVGAVWAFLFVFLDRETEVEQVAYSRAQISDMVERGSKPQEGPGPSGPAGPGGSTAGPAAGIVERP